MNSFTELLATFAGTVQANRGPDLAMLFTEDGVYEDGFFGPDIGRTAIAAMLQRSTTPKAAISGSLSIRSAAPSAMPAFALATLRGYQNAQDGRSCSKVSPSSGFAAN